jgi:hypothetical protein
LIFALQDLPARLPTVELPLDWPLVATSATAVLAGRQAIAPASVDMPGMARLMHLSAGVVRIRFDAWRDRTWLFRAAGSAGGRFPLEIYISARGVDGLEDGVHWYDPVGHALIQVGPPAGGEVTTLVVTGVPWRTGWRYAERGCHIYRDAGSMLAQRSRWRPRRLRPGVDVSRTPNFRPRGAMASRVPACAVGLRSEPAIQPRGGAAAGS